MILYHKNEFQAFKQCLSRFEKSKYNIQFRGEALGVSQRPKTKLYSKSSLEEVFNVVSSKTLSLTQYYKELKKINSNKSILSELIKAFIFMKTANKAKAEAIIKSILSKNFDSYLIETDNLDISVSKQILLFTALLQRFNEDLDNKKLVRVLNYYLFSNTYGKFKFTLDEKFKIPQSIASIRALFNSNTYGYMFPAVWGPAILNESSKKEYSEYIYQVELEQLLRQSPRNTYYLKDITKIELPKKLIVSNVKKLKNSKNELDQYYYISLVDTENFYKFITANSKINVGVLTNQKRRFFQGLTNNNSIGLFAILKLLELGDESEEYFYQVLSIYRGL